MPKGRPVRLTDGRPSGPNFLGNWHSNRVACHDLRLRIRRMQESGRPCYLNQSLGHFGL